MKQENNFIRLSKNTKQRLSLMKHNRTYDELISSMIDYFEMTGFSPEYPHPANEVIENLKKIEKKINSLMRKPSELLELQARVFELTEQCDMLKFHLKYKHETIINIIMTFIIEIKANESSHYYHIPKKLVEDFMTVISSISSDDTFDNV